MIQIPTELIELEFMKIEFYEHFMIVTPADGVVINEENVKKIQELAANFYKNRPFGYISNRVNDYSRNIPPKFYTLQFQKLFAFAIIYKTEITLEVANFEKHFIKVPFKTFKRLSLAKKWMLEQQQL